MFIRGGHMEYDETIWVGCDNQAEPVADTGCLSCSKMESLAFPLPELCPFVTSYVSVASEAALLLSIT